jgi:hypothetical protein
MIIKDGIGAGLPDVAPGSLGGEAECYYLGCPDGRASVGIVPRLILGLKPCFKLLTPAEPILTKLRIEVAFDRCGCRASA